jgi:[CysO sulfur-carrier protein]-S-L-cysteine hydrolase
MMPSSLGAALVAELMQVYPAEGCGFLGGKHGRVTHLYPISNIHPTPHTAFQMNPAQQISAWYAIHQAGLDLIAIYHSHPHTPAYPSAHDQHALTFRQTIQLIISLTNPHHPELRAFYLAPHLQELPIYLTT